MDSTNRASSGLRVRRADDRGRGQHGWLDSRHTFSFAGYYDPAQMGFHALRVINDDRVAAGAGFSTHPHRDMEIVSYVVEGALEHRDSTGTGSVIKPGEVQRMSAGRGVTHSEYNHSQESPVRFLQIWIQPNARGGEPSYEQRDFGAERNGRLKLVASNDGRDGSLTIKQDVAMFASVLDAGESVSYQQKSGRGVWIQVVRGQLQVGEQVLGEGDAVAAEQPGTLEIEATEDSEFLLFDLPVEAEAS